MAGERTVKIRFTGDNSKLDRAAKAAERSVAGVGRAVGSVTRMLAGLGPAAVPALAGGTVAAVGFGASVAAAGVAVGVFAGVTKSAFSEVQKASDKTQDLRDKIELLTEQAKVAEKTGLADAGKIEKARDKAISELIARYNLMPPALRRVTMAYDGMKSSWQRFVDTNKPKTYSLMTQGFDLIKRSIKDLQPFFDMGAYAAQRLLNVMKRSVNEGSIDRLAKMAGPALHSLTTIILNTASAVGSLSSRFAQAQGQGVLEWLVGITAKWKEWATTGNSSGIERFLKWVEEHGPTAWKTLTDLATAAKNIAIALGPLVPISAAIAAALSSMIAAVPPELITTIVAAWIAWGAALKLYAAYQAIATAAQWAQNAAMFAWPGTWIIAGILALIAVIALIATKTDWFQRAWKWAWGGIKSAASAVGSWFKNTLWPWMKETWDSIVRRAIEVVVWFQGMDRKVRSALSGIRDAIVSPFRNAFNAIVRFWNDTVGRLSFNLPGWMGGGGWTAPRLSERASGGPVSAGRSYLVGERGPEVITMGSQNGNVIPNRELTGDGGGDVYEFVFDLGEGIKQRFRIHDRDLKRRAGARPRGAMA